MNMNENQKASKSAVFYTVVSVICLVFIGFFLLNYGGSEKDKTADIAQMQNLTEKVQDMESEVTKKEGEVAELVDEFEQKTGTKSAHGLNLVELAPAEQELLEQEIGKEKDVSIRSLLQSILNKKNEIANLQEKIAEIESFLPRPHIAQKGESHYQIAMAFLVEEKGLDKESAAKLLAKTALFEELAAGFKVWNFYTGEEYGTSVTQGEALVSPNVFVHRAKKRLEGERDRAITECNLLTENLETVKAQQLTVTSELDRVSHENEELSSRVTDMDKKFSSMAYKVDSQKNLKKKGILKGGFLASPKLLDVSPDIFDESIDLNTKNRVVILASHLGIDRINDVDLYPKFHQKGRSYEVSITTNKKIALLTFKDKEKFMNERVVIAVK